MKKEVHFLFDIIANPRRPLVAIIGGKKISTKLRIIRRLLEIVDKILIGGAMAFTFFRAMGHDVGDSFVEEDYIDVAADIIQYTSTKSIVLQFNIDCIVAPTKTIISKTWKRTHLLDASECQVMDFDSIPNGYSGADIGPVAINQFRSNLKDAQTIVMNGMLK